MMKEREHNNTFKEKKKLYDFYDTKINNFILIYIQIKVHLDAMCCVLKYSRHRLLYFEREFSLYNFIN